ARPGRTERTQTAGARLSSLDRSDRDAAAAQTAAAGAAQGTFAAAAGVVARAETAQNPCYAVIPIAGDARPAGAWGDRASAQAKARTRPDCDRRPARFARHAAGRGLRRPDPVPRGAAGARRPDGAGDHR